MIKERKNREVQRFVQGRTGRGLRAGPRPHLLFGVSHRTMRGAWPSLTLVTQDLWSQCPKICILTNFLVIPDFENHPRAPAGVDSHSSFLILLPSSLPSFLPTAPDTWAPLVSLQRTSFVRLISCRAMPSLLQRNQKNPVIDASALCF